MPALSAIWRLFLDGCQYSTGMCNYILTWITNNDTLIWPDQLYVPYFIAHVNSPVRYLTDGSRISDAQLAINHADKTVQQTNLQ